MMAAPGLGFRLVRGARTGPGEGGATPAPAPAFHALAFMFQGVERTPLVVADQVGAPHGA